ncbi:DmsC/YnfH family molybdoenzyme membrane anchor subunit [Eggerthella sinensis]|uniref:DmsC/YnfH family molybdoenzyme membrane anchor subunit n=1 Tax=Eggerthella sinensis TaxID=242230 RepID=UPI001D0980EF|nr:DmsC/YnfH family molybdoenzyme membrane anchor subunit [Eggerthella sinensis]MCB7037833.1 hypothetical protein [Eggerthella sinensis]
MEIQWPLVLFTLFCCFGSGLFGVLCVADLMPRIEVSRTARTRALLVAAASIVAGGIASFFHLENVPAAITVIHHLGTDIGRELIFCAFALIMMGVYRKRIENPGKIVSIIGVVAAVLLSYQCGASYVMDARPAWDTLYLPMNYVMSAAAFGLVAMLVFVDDAVLSRIAIAALSLQAVLLAAYGIDANVDATSSAMLIASLIVGQVAPAALLFLKTHRRAAIVAAIVCTATGGILFRCFMWLVGTTLPYSVI